MNMNSVVKLNIVDDEIAVVIMEDRESKNTFSRELLTGLVETFKIINENTSLKTVIIHGYDSIFCAGGTQEELIDIFEKKISFTDLDFIYKGFLSCPLPVISAMQGHAIGGGLAFGLYADIIILGEERLYSANFMKYGFTPGLGATFIIKEKFGINLANEMMLTAANYHGGTLKERGVSAAVVKKHEVIEKAMDIARKLKDMPRISLMELKKTIAKPFLDKLDDIIKREVEMHEITFAGQEVRTRIENLFGR